MKGILFTISALFGFNVFACPTINATFDCTIQDGPSYEQTISTRRAGAKTIYTLTSDSVSMDMIADGKPYPFEQDGMSGATYRASCAGMKIRLVVEGVLLPGDDLPGATISSTHQITVNGAGNYSDVIDTVWNGQQQPRQVENCQAR